MSWSLDQTGKRGDFDRAVSNTELARMEVQNPGCSDAVIAAWEAVYDLLNAGVLGDETKRFSVTLRGHHNPGCEPVTGWSNDMVNISIVQATEG